MSKQKNNALRPMNVTVGDSPFDRILANHNDPLTFPLSVTEQEMAERWFEAFTLMLNHRSKMWIVKHWVEKKGLSQGQAYIDIRNAEALYGNVMKADKLGATAKISLWLEQSLERCIQKGDEKGAQRALAMLIKAFGLDKDDDLKFNPEKLENYEIQFTVKDGQLKILNDFKKGGVSDFNSLNVIDIPHENLSDGKED